MSPIRYLHNEFRLNGTHKVTDLLISAT
uniref:Uncharacterized protein n=1 Tax=Arundo donax TaxID=35708 RepID=A0A0A9B2H1_ARUDO